MRRLATVLGLVLLHGACGHSQDDEDARVVANTPSLIPVAPAPRASSKPSPEPPSEDPLPATPGGGNGNDGGSPGGGVCGSPFPPAVTRIAIGIYSSGGDRVQLDSTPLVGPDLLYCEAIGYTDGRSFCPVRPNGHPERLACEAARIGRARDTGRVGPTWSANGSPCTGAGAGASCQNHPTNQFQVFTYGSGTFRACADTGVCGEIVL